MTPFRPAMEINSEGSVKLQLVVDRYHDLLMTLLNGGAGIYSLLFSITRAPWRKLDQLVRCKRAASL